LAACYTEYINGYDHALEVLRSSRKDNESLDVFIKRQEKAKECRFLPIEAFLGLIYDMRHGDILTISLCSYANSTGS